jgi:adenylate cyclase
MAEEGFKRKLTAVLSADAVGYSRLMAEDEAATVETIAAYREIMSSLIQQHRGRVVDSPGDNILAEFSSVVDAVQCAVAVQNEFETLNADLSENRRMEFRIGINLGDVIDEEDRLYGDGVNISARLEALADAGGVCISGTAFDQVKGKLSLGYQFVGEQTVKNIPDPIRVYKVLMDERDAGKLIGVGKKAPKSRWAEIAAIVVFVAIGLVIYQFYVRSPAIEPASVEKMAYPLPDKASIAVLPFVNMSDDQKQEYFSDGITESIIMALSKVRDMFVIARNSTFAYKGKAVKIQQVAEELGVRYVLEGSVQKTENRVRITAQLIDAIKGYHLWAERYDRELKDLFALQDEITIKIITALQVQLTEGEEVIVEGVGTDNLDAYLKYMQANVQLRRWNKEGNALSRKFAKEAISFDPEYADAYLMLSATHLMDMMYGSTESLEQSLKQAEELVQKAISLRGTYADARAFLGRIYLTKRQYDEAIAEGERAVAMAPNSAFVHAALAFSLKFAGRPDEAIALFKKAIRLSPIPDTWYLTSLGSCYVMVGRYEEAASAYKKALRLNPEDVHTHACLAATYNLLGHKEEARAEVAEVLRIDPKFSLGSYLKGRLYKNPEDLKREIEAMRKAGLPE